MTIPVGSSPTHVVPFPFMMEPLTQITPFTYRDGMTYAKFLEQLRRYLTDFIVPEFNGKMDELLVQFQAGIENAEQTIITSKNEWQQLFDAFMANFDAELQQLNDAGFVRLIKNPDSLTSIAMRAHYARVYTPEAYGAIGKNNPDDATLDTVGWQLALNAARDNRGTVQAMGEYWINDTLQWDVISNVTGHHRLNSAITDITKYVVRAWSSDNGDVSSPIRQRAIAWRGGIFWGNRTSKAINLSGVVPPVGQNTNKVAHISFEHCVVKNFDLGVNFGANAYMITFLQCNIQGNRLGILHENAGNSGERNEFIACDITGNDRAFELPSGQSFHFTNCSFSYNIPSLGKIDNGSVFFTNCHMEFTKPTEDYLILDNDGAYAGFDNCRWLVAERTHGNEFPVIALKTLRSKAVINGGHLTGSAKTEYFSKGPGSMVSQNTNTLNLSALTPFLNDTNQSIMDPNFDSSTLIDDWEIGGFAVATMDTGAMVNGAQSLKLTNTALGSNYAMLFIPVEAGDRILTAFDYKFNLPGKAFSLNWRWANAKRVKAGSDLSVTIRASDDAGVGTVWRNIKQPGVSYMSAPSWARYIVMTFLVNGLGTDSQLNLDNFKVSKW